eukprot:TRINITY_DN16764_c0_g1_i9.p1 TRINITY_DN16764_c0_g1~~TRINITY_DN16764_c0_g1_i9.p1  ORF type:complete len:289 (+),score=22.89 TRINITY_DN16764_c0_g1_i9:176-1042(+)
MHYGSCTQICQRIANDYDVTIGLTWGSATEDVQAYWTMKRCGQDSSVRPLPKNCRKWSCSCQAARYDKELRERSDVMEWADNFCWWLPGAYGLRGPEKVGYYAAFYNAGVRPEGGLALLDDDEVDSFHKGLFLDQEACMSSCDRIPDRCVAVEYLEPEGWHRSRCILHQLGHSRQVQPLQELIKGGRAYDVDLDEDLPEGTWTTYVRHEVLPSSVKQQAGISRAPTRLAKCSASHDFCVPASKDPRESGPCCFQGSDAQLRVFDCAAGTARRHDLGSWVERPGAVCPQ